MRIPRRQFLAGAGLTAAALVAGSRPAHARPWSLPFTPKPPPYPDFTDRGAILVHAQHMSDALESHIRAWLDGRAPAEIPDSLIPRGLDRKDFPAFTLVRPEQIAAEEQWLVRPATDRVDHNAVQGYFPDPHCTYLLLPVVAAPVGCRVVITGQFPHARFFDLQATPPFRPEVYHNGYYGVPEVPILDADLDPELGSVNPFRPGADRAAVRRDYRAAFDLKVGDPMALNPQAFRPPDYRDKGNVRAAGAIFYQGPGQFGAPAVHDWRDRFEMAGLWVRYYAPDHAAGALGGVPLPKVRYELPDGRRFFVRVDITAFRSRMNRARAARATPPEEPGKGFGPHKGWGKQWGIARAIFSGVAQVTGLVDAQYVRELDRALEGRGENLPPPGDYEHAATECPYITYLNRGMALGPGMVCVLTGRRPTTPRTRHGERRMDRAQARYWSLTGYDIAWPEKDGFSGAALHTVMDDEIVTDGAGWYVLVLSRPEDRPRNAAPESGVTWVDWGPTARVSWTLRWMSTPPEQDFALSPHQGHLGWETDWAGVRYDRGLLGRNDRSGFLGEYQPVVHYLSRAGFERLGERVRPEAVPAWS